MMLALFLDRHGVRSVVFNTEPDVRFHPKGSTHSARTMEHYRRLGFAEAVRKLGLPADHPTDVAYFTRFNGYELARLRMPSVAEKRAAVAASPATGQVPEPIHRANQMYVERAMAERVRARPNIALRFGWQVTGLAADADGVSLRAQPVSGGATETWRAAYAVGCDGGRSFVRRTLGIPYGGEKSLDQEFFGGRMVSVYLRAPTLYPQFLKDRRAFQYWVFNPELRTAIVALDGKDEFLLWSRASDETIAGDIARLMLGCTGMDVPLEILALNPWTSGVALVADRFGAGRVLLAGDAVHLFTPTGGFGMNTGIDDAANLSWKLAAMVQGWGGARLLDPTRPSAGRSPSATPTRRARLRRMSAMFRCRRRWRSRRRPAKRRGAASARSSRPSARSSRRSACSSARAMTARRSSCPTARPRTVASRSMSRAAFPAAARRIYG